MSLYHYCNKCGRACNIDHDADKSKDLRDECDLKQDQKYDVTDPSDSQVYAMKVHFDPILCRACMSHVIEEAVNTVKAVSSQEASARR